MGGLWRKLPITWVVMLIGGLALSGIPPFSGYYSKDAILGRLLRRIARSACMAGPSGTVTAGLTAFYTARMVRSPSTARRARPEMCRSMCMRARW